MKSQENKTSVEIPEKLLNTNNCEGEAEECESPTTDLTNERLNNKSSSVKVRTSKGKGKSSKSLERKRESATSTSPTKDVGEKSKIPVIHSTATGFLPCDYYRQKLLQENGCTDLSWCPTFYNSIQKTAGQKVISKLAAEQKRLEEQAAAQRKRTEFVFHDELGFCEIPAGKIPLRKKQTRLEPLVPKCC